MDRYRPQHGSHEAGGAEALRSPGRVEAADDVPALIPFDADAKKVLELTFREALRLGHNDISTQHILLALLEVEDGHGAVNAR